MPYAYGIDAKARFRGVDGFPRCILDRDSSQGRRSFLGRKSDFQHVQKAFGRTPTILSFGQDIAPGDSAVCDGALRIVRIIIAPSFCSECHARFDLCLELGAVRKVHDDQPHLLTFVCGIARSRTREHRVNAERLWDIGL